MTTYTVYAMEAGGERAVAHIADDLTVTGEWGRLIADMLATSEWPDNPRKAICGSRLYAVADEAPVSTGELSYPAPHKGRPGERGGSLPRGAEGPDQAEDDDTTSGKLVAGTFSKVRGKVIHYEDSRGQHQRGHFESKRVIIKGDGEGILKSDHTMFENWGDLGFSYGLARREAAAWEVDRALGLDIVPECALIEHKDGTVESLGVWVTDVKVGHDALDEGLDWEHIDVQDIGRMALLDGITGNADRQSANWMVDRDGYLWAIDHGLMLYNESANLDWFWTDHFWPGRGTQQIGKKLGIWQWDTPDGSGFYKYPLDRKYRKKLKMAIADGSLWEALRVAVAPEERDMHERLIRAAMGRAQKIEKNWDEYFRDPYDYEVWEGGFRLGMARRISALFGFQRGQTPRRRLGRAPEQEDGE